MLSTMMHEEFYRSGLYIDKSLGLYVGWVSHPRSFADCMPVVNETRDLALIFSGEHFSDAASIHLLRRKGHQCEGTNASHLIHLYEETGDAFFRRLNGWFGAVLADRPRARVVLFNDRLGMHRLYYYENSDTFYFASEAKALLAVLPESRGIDVHGLAEFLACDCVLDNRTLFNNVKILPQGTAWVFTHGRLRRRSSYFLPTDWDAQSRGIISDAVAEVRDRFVEILPSYLTPTETVALSLTGGLDSRLIVAAAGEKLAGRSSYTFAGRRDTMDVRLSRRVATIAGLRHQVLRLEGGFFANFPRLAEDTIYISDGTLGVTGAHDLYFNRLARNIGAVRLTGLFGSEILREGRILSRAATSTFCFAEDLREHVAAASNRVATLRQAGRLTASLYHHIPWRMYGSRAVEESQVVVRSPFTDNRFVELVHALPNALRRTPKLQLAVIESLNLTLSRLISCRGHLSASHGVRRLIARALLSASFKLDYFYFFASPNWIVRCESALRGVPGIFYLTGFHKFEHYRRWYREELRDFVGDLLLEPRTLQRPYFDGVRLARAVNAHLQGNANHADVVTKTLTIELVMRRLLDSTRLPATPPVGLRARWLQAGSKVTIRSDETRPAR